MAFVNFWPHVVVMVLFGALALRSRNPSWGTSFVLLVAASLLLAFVYRWLLSGLVPPAGESIGWKGWLATLLTVAVPLMAVMLAGRVSRRMTSPAHRGFLMGAAGVLALFAYPAYGLALYCGFTGICP